MAPSVRATVAQFNAVTSCVVTSVLEDPALRVQQRAHLLEKWIDIAQVRRRKGVGGRGAICFQRSGVEH